MTQALIQADEVGCDGQDDECNEQGGSNGSFHFNYLFS
jgi:hypothetical protein